MNPGSKEPDKILVGPWSWEMFGAFPEENSLRRRDPQGGPGKKRPNDTGQ